MSGHQMSGPGGPRRDFVQGKPMLSSVRALRPGVERFPRACGQCGSAFLSYSPPMGHDRFGAVTCNTCGEVCTYVSAPLRPVEPGDERPWRLEGCAVTCLRNHHDPLAHEAYGQRLARAETAGRPVEGSVQTGPLMVDFVSRDALVEGLAAHLTRTEFEILATCARWIGQRVSQEELLHKVWGFLPEAAEPYARDSGSHLLRVNVARLRKKLGAAAHLLRTIPTAGYVLDDEPATAQED